MGNSSAIYDLVITQNSSTSFTFTYQLALAKGNGNTIWVDNEQVTIDDFRCDTDYYKKIERSGSKSAGYNVYSTYTYYLEISRYNGHKFSKWDPIYVEGVLDDYCKRNCSICGNTEYEYHSYASATCEKGSYCTKCGVIVSEPVSDAHSFGDWSPNGDGTHTRTCKFNADHTETADCSYSAATCKEPAKCIYCGHTTGEPDQENHTSTKFRYEQGENGMCTLCFYQCEHPSFIKGYCDKCNYKCIHPSTDGDSCSVCKELVKIPEQINGVYQIFTAKQLFWFADFVNAGNTSANAVLREDIVINEGEMSSTTDSATVYHWSPIGNAEYKYAGTFDGNGKTVSGLYFNNAGVSYVGLFGCVDTGGVVKNTGVINAYFRGSQNVGGVAGRNHGRIEKCYKIGNFTLGGDYTGGVSGYNNGTIIDSHNTGNVYGNDYIGGITGRNGGTIERCYNTGKVGNNIVYDYAGGVAGANYKTIKNCYNTGAVRVGAYVGGVVGYMNDSGTVLANCYNRGQVSGNAYVPREGGVLGVGPLAAVTNPYLHT